MTSFNNNNNNNNWCSNLVTSGSTSPSNPVACPAIKDGVTTGLDSSHCSTSTTSSLQRQYHLLQVMVPQHSKINTQLSVNGDSSSSAAVNQDVRTRIIYAQKRHEGCEANRNLFDRDISCSSYGVQGPSSQSRRNAMAQSGYTNSRDNSNNEYSYQESSGSNLTSAGFNPDYNLDRDGRTIEKIVVNDGRVLVDSANCNDGRRDRVGLVPMEAATIRDFDQFDGRRVFAHCYSHGALTSQADIKKEPRDISYDCCTDLEEKRFTYYREYCTMMMSPTMNDDIEMVSAYCTREEALMPTCQRRGSLQLWQFLVALLDNPTNQLFIAWTGRGLEFKLIEPEEVARRWGIQKNRPAMNYDKLSRSLRYYYEKGIMQKVAGERYVYRFVCDPEALFAMAFPDNHRPILKADCLPPAADLSAQGQHSGGSPRDSRSNSSSDRDVSKLSEASHDADSQSGCQNFKTSIFDKNKNGKRSGETTADYEACTTSGAADKAFFSPFDANPVSPRRENYPVASWNYGNNDLGTRGSESGGYFPTLLDMTRAARETNAMSTVSSYDTLMTSSKPLNATFHQSSSSSSSSSPSATISRYELQHQHYGQQRQHYNHQHLPTMQHDDVLYQEQLEHHLQHQYHQQRQQNDYPHYNPLQQQPDHRMSTNVVCTNGHEFNMPLASQISQYDYNAAIYQQPPRAHIHAPINPPSCFETSRSFPFPVPHTAAGLPRQALESEKASCDDRSFHSAKTALTYGATVNGQSNLSTASAAAVSTAHNVTVQLEQRGRSEDSSSFKTTGSEEEVAGTYYSQASTGSFFMEPGCVY